MTRALAFSAKAAVIGSVLAVFLTACQGHYHPRFHVDDAPPPPGHVKKQWYNP